MLVFSIKHFGNPMDDDHLIFNTFNERIRNKSQELGFKTLLEHNIQDEPNTLAFYASITTKKKVVRRFDAYGLYADLNIATLDLRHIISCLFIFLPHINDPVKESGAHSQNLYDHMYFMNVGFAYQILYIYWDRIGDLLDNYFPTGLTEREVYFATVIDKIPDIYQSSSYYDWLVNFKKTEFTNLNKVRKEIVHYRGIEHISNMKAIFGSISQNKNELEKLKKQKEGYAELFRKQYKIMFDGFENALRLINELPDKET
jgi:Cthe_2314-like HEPN